MNGVVLTAGVIGAIDGGIVVWLASRPRRLWQCCGVLAVGVASLLILAVKGDRSWAAHDVVFVVFCVLLGFNVFCTFMDRRAASALPWPLDRWFRVHRRQSQLKNGRSAVRPRP
jgi:drug/metabolite transporter superfamily protein YnfA